MGRHSASAEDTRDLQSAGAPVATAVTGTRAVPPDDMTHRQILRVIVGLLAGLFTALISSTNVSTALPTIIGDLHGTQRQYTWLITASLLAMCITTSIWGKLSDQFSKKLLVQLSLVIFVAGSIAAGMSQSIGFMIACRVVQGVGMGGLTALTQSILGTIVAPRERGRYSGYMAGTMAVSTVAGPLLGGLLVDSAWGWRACFYLCVPLAIVSLIILQFTLHLHEDHKRARIDYTGAVLLAITAGLPLIWVTFAGTDFPWWSSQTGWYLGGALVALALLIVVELRAPQPIIPIRLIANRNTALIIIASISVGVGMFGATTFLTQYFQTARAYSPTQAGLLVIPMMAGMLISSTVSGQVISRTGRWKFFLVGGAVMLSVGFYWMSYIDHRTPLWDVSAAMAFMGIGMGAMMQNLVLAVQNSVDVKDVGAASASVAFFRTFGGAIGVSVLGAILATRLQDGVVAGVTKLGIPASALTSMQSGGGLDFASMPPQIAQIVRASYADATGHIFVISTVFGVIALLASVCVREVALRTTVSMKSAPEQVGGQHHAGGTAQHSAEGSGHHHREVPVSTAGAVAAPSGLATQSEL